MVEVRDDVVSKDDGRLLKMNIVIMRYVCTGRSSPSLLPIEERIRASAPSVSTEQARAKPSSVFCTPILERKTIAILPACISVASSFVARHLYPRRHLCLQKHVRGLLRRRCITKSSRYKLCYITSFSKPSFHQDPSPIRAPSAQGTQQFPGLFGPVVLVVTTRLPVWGEAGNTFARAHDGCVFESLTTLGYCFWDLISTHDELCMFISAFHIVLMLMKCV